MMMIDNHWLCYLCNRMMMIVLHQKTKMIMIVKHLQTSEYTPGNQNNNGNRVTSCFFNSSSQNETKLIEQGECLHWFFLVGFNSFIHFEIKTKIKKNSKKTPAPANHKDSEDSLANIDLLANCDVIVCVFQNIRMFLDRIFVCLFVGKIKRPPL